MRMRKKPNLMPRMERCASLFVPEPKSLRGVWSSTFGAYRAVYAEIGCGKGRFTAETAKQNPDILFVAIERVKDALVVAMERAFAESIPNVRFCACDAALLRDIFAPGEVGRVYINFCDPWVGNKRAKRRLTSPVFLPLYSEILCSSGEIHFKTDNLPLFEYSLAQLNKAGFTVTEITRNLHEFGVNGVMTDFEEKFHGEGVPICRCTALKAEL